LIRSLAFLLVFSTTARAQELSDEELVKMSEEETIEVFDERPDKPFDRDTTVRLTGEELAARGAVDLATALDLLPDVDVRDAGRGGFNVDIRGARKGAVSILIDGVLVSDPYYGTFDVSTIPITDIVQIRMSTTPQSPIDGPGGPGGVIEVLTRDAVGPQLVIGRTTADTLPSFGIAASARVALSKTIGLRLSAAGLAGARREPSCGDRRSTTGISRGQTAHRARRFSRRPPLHLATVGDELDLDDRSRDERAAIREGRRRTRQAADPGTSIRQPFASPVTQLHGRESRGPAARRELARASHRRGSSRDPADQQGSAMDRFGEPGTRLGPSRR
jgi:outer membrane receptor protein involved in Fe transport